MTKFLDTVLREIRSNRPKVPEALKYTIRTEKDPNYTFACLGFRTRGCRFNIAGGCTMCDYWISDPLTSDQIVANVEEALQTLDFEPDEMLVNVSGSFFDDLEVPKDARTKIYSLFSRFKKTVFIFETHATTITDNNIIDCINHLGNERIRIEMGLESSNPWVLEYCVNKPLKLAHVKTAIRRLRKYNVPSIVNILIGIPFLSPYEIVIDTMSSVQWAFENGANRCVLFTMNSKPYTLTHWMGENDLYNIPPLWALIDVLCELDPELLPRIGIAWHRTRPQYHPLYMIDNVGPNTCPNCYTQVMQLIDDFLLQRDRTVTLRKLMTIKCECRDIWQNQRLVVHTPLRERIVTNYEFIGKKVLGNKWWSQHGPSVIDQVKDVDEIDQRISRVI